MRKLLLASLVAALTATAAPSAQAHPTYDFTGLCELNSVRTAGGLWFTDVEAAVVATAAGNNLPAVVPISVKCVLHDFWGGSFTALSASSPNGVAAGSSLLSTGSISAYWMLCTNVVVGGEPHGFCTWI